MTHAPTAGDWALEGRLRLRDVYRQAVATFRARFLVVTLAAVAVFGPLSLLEALGELRADNEEAGLIGRPLLITLILFLLRSTAVLFGSTFYSGLLDRIVGAHQHGHEYRSVWHVLRTLPYRRLIAADILASLAVLVGLAFFVVPGIIIFTLVSLVGPVITIENADVRRAFARSVRLVRRNPRLAFLAITAPVIAEEAAHHALEAFVIGNGSLLSELLSGLLFTASVGALVGLVEVTLAHALLLRERARDAEPAA